MHEEPRFISPEEQIDNVRAFLERARAAQPYEGQAWAIRSAEAQLAEMEAKHAAGELRPLPADLPF